MRHGLRKTLTSESGAVSLLLQIICFRFKLHQILTRTATLYILKYVCACQRWWYFTWDEKLLYMIFVPRPVCLKLSNCIVTSPFLQSLSLSLSATFSLSFTFTGIYRYGNIYRNFSTTVSGNAFDMACYTHTECLI